MVSYMSVMFPNHGRPAPPPTNSAHYPGYHAYPNYPPPDQNSNLQLYSGIPHQFDFGHGGTPSSWAHTNWSTTNFPASCRTYEWEGSTSLPNQSPEVTPTSEPTHTSPRSPYTAPDPRNRSPPPASDQFNHALPSHYNPQILTPPLMYKQEPPTSTTELNMGPASMSSDLNDDCPSPGSPASRPGPARSPYEWMKKPAYPSPGSQSDPNARTRTKDKYRVVYSDHQRLELEKEFHYSRYITIRRKAELANGIGLSERQVKIWFQNRRAKERRSMKKQEDVLVKEKLDGSVPMQGAFSPHNMGMSDVFNPSSLGMHFNQSFPHSFPPFMKFE